MTVPRLRASAVCVHDGKLLCVALRDPATGERRLFVPGGGLEEGETPLLAAERETLEETGYAVSCDPASELIVHYPFAWNGIDYDCTTHFYRAALLDATRAPDAVDDVFFNEGAAWLPLASLEAELGFHTAILAAVRKLVS